MGLFFIPVATVVFGSVSESAAGVASGANNSFRELGGTMGVAVLASVFTGAGGYASRALFVDGIRPALFVGAAVLAIGTVAALAIPGKRKSPDVSKVTVGEPALAVA
jgi:hypothetical protein